MLQWIEVQVIKSLNWPSFALRTIALLTSVIFIINLIQLLFAFFGSNKDNKIYSDKKDRPTFEFRIFQLQYLSVFFITMLADWLQGTNMYTLYKSYGVDIGTLFLTGFLSSAIFGTFLGIYVDRWGRKLGVIIFCLLEIVINLLEHVQSMPTLMVGRILGGLSTSLLFSAFESWMVSEHRKRNFSESLLSSTFAITSWGNGLIAIGAGFLAQISSDTRGDIGPFQVAILLTIVALLLVLTWRENYGRTSDGDGVLSIWSSIRASFKTILTNPTMLYLGLSQAFFEGGTYTFVFMWVPALMNVYEGVLPTGLVFSCFMLAMTIGGMLFSLLLPIFPGGAEGLTIIVYILAAISMAVPVFKFEFWWIFSSFLVLEFCVGMFNSCGAILRSKYYPEDQQSSIMSVLRLPLNLLVVIGTKLTDNANDITSLQFVFKTVVCMHLTATFLQILMQFTTSKNNKIISKKLI